MKIHEHQAKELFLNYDIPVTREYLCHTLDEALHAAENLAFPMVVKAQVLVGGRGKAGGIKLATNRTELESAVSHILGMDIKGYNVEKVLVAEGVKFEKEFYLGFTIDRNTKSVVCMASAEGGVEIEEIAKTAPDAIHKISIDPDIGMTDFMARKIAFKLFTDAELIKQATYLLKQLYLLFVDTDASLAEINPLVINDKNELIALDGKMNFDDNALYRQTAIAAMNEPDEDEKKELEASEKGLSYIRLNGNIGCMVNGAGLAMATMDLIKHFGGNPANFLDIGGSSNPDKVVEAMKLLLADSNVEVVMINIFGGITRCDDVAHGIVTALNQLQTKIPIVVRLAGMNAKEGLEIIQQAGLPVVNSMSEAAQEAIRLSQTN